MENIYWIVTGIIALLGFVHCLIHFLAYLKLILRSTKLKPTTMKDLLEMKDELAQKPRYLRLEGKASQDTSIQTPFSRKDVIYFDAWAEQCWISSQGKGEKKESWEVYQNVQLSPFFLIDETGKAPVLIHRLMKVQTENREFNRYNEPLSYPGVDFNYKSFKPRYVKEEYFEYTERYIPDGEKIYFLGEVQFENGVFLLKKTEEKTAFEMVDPILKYAAQGSPANHGLYEISGISDIPVATLFSTVIKKLAIYGFFLLLCASCMVLSLVALTGQPHSFARFLFSSKGMALYFLNFAGTIGLFIVHSFMVKFRSAGNYNDQDRFTKFKCDRRQDLRPPM